MNNRESVIYVVLRLTVQFYGQGSYPYIWDLRIIQVVIVGSVNIWSDGNFLIILIVCMFSSCGVAPACPISPANRKRGKQVLTNRRGRLIGPTFAPDLNGRSSVEPAVNGIAAIFSTSSSRLPLFFSRWTRIFFLLSGAPSQWMVEKSTFK